MSGQGVVMIAIVFGVILGLLIIYFADDTDNTDWS